MSKKVNNFERVYRELLDRYGFFSALRLIMNDR